MIVMPIDPHHQLKAKDIESLLLPNTIFEKISIRGDKNISSYFFQKAVEHCQSLSLNWSRVGHGFEKVIIPTAQVLKTLEIIGTSFDL